MASLPRWMLRHRVTVEPFTGEGPYGAAYGPPVEVRCLVEDKRRRVLDANGTQVTASTTFYAPLATVCPVRSRVTLPDGRKSFAVAVARRDGAGLPTPDHLEVSVT